MIYLAGPYTHPMQQVRLARFRAHREASIKLMREGVAVFSPIVQGHSLLPELDMWGQEEWMKWCMPLVHASKAVYVLKLPAWERSKGTAQEIKACDHGVRQIKYLEARDYIKLDTFELLEDFEKSFGDKA